MQLNSPDRTVEPRSRMFIRHQRMLKSFIRSLVPHLNDAEDILQEVGVLILAGKGDEVDPGHFSAWARGVARNLVLHHRRAWRRKQALPTTRYMDMVEAAFSQADSEEEIWNERRDALAICMESIAVHERDLLTKRYVGALTSDAIASEQGRSAVAVRVALLRLRRSLLRCVERRLTVVEGHS